MSRADYAANKAPHTELITVAIARLSSIWILSFPDVFQPLLTVLITKQSYQWFLSRAWENLKMTLVIRLGLSGWRPCETALLWVLDPHRKFS